MEFDATFLAALERDLEAAWVLVGGEDLLPGPETWFVHESAGRSLIVARDRAGTLGAFINSCSHRGTRLCTGSGSGRLTCPYHGWVFGCDGSLLGAFRRAGLPEFDDADHGLTRLAVATLGALIFVHGQTEPPDLRVALGSISPRLDALRAPVFVDRAEHSCAWEVLRARCADPAVLARAPGESPQVESFAPNGVLLSTRDALILTSVVPLGPARSRRESRVYPRPSAQDAVDAARGRRLVSGFYSELP